MERAINPVRLLTSFTKTNRSQISKTLNLNNRKSSTVESFEKFSKVLDRRSQDISDRELERRPRRTLDDSLLSLHPLGVLTSKQRGVRFKVSFDGHQNNYTT